MSAVPTPTASLAPPTADEWRRIFALLDTALELEPSARDDWLATLDPDEAALAPWLDELLRAHASRDTADFLGAGGPFALDAAAHSEPTQPGAASIVGPYRLLREIGQGGMATVWLAERADGLLERKVAVKLPHASWGGAWLADRMARERNILASLTHPNIARLYDAGLAADGRPYLALEFVDGLPIDTHAATRGLSVRERVGLVVQVARAVAYAHARLVVHRDLKPSNILVDAQGRAHLLDFGVARLVDPGDDAPSSQATVSIGRALTPDYASPEQIRGDAIGTASDVYSLGVVAYELLAGARPYRLPKNAGALALAEAIGRVQVAPASEAATDPGVRGELAGDLDAILARALASAGADRYATVDAFADDLERHLRGEPVRARAASRAYVAGRWVRRHKLETAIALAIVVAAAGGAYAQVAVSLALAAGALVALWQRNAALRQAEIARAALARGEQVKDFIASIFTQAVPRAGHGGVVAAADLLRAAARRVETDLAAQPAVAAELGALIGASFSELNEVHAAMEWLPKAVELCVRELGATHHLTLQTRFRYVEAANYVGELETSQALLPPLVRDLRAAGAKEAALLAATMETYGFLHAKRARETEAIDVLQEGLAAAATHLGEGSDEALSMRVALSNTLIHFGRKREALDAMGPALALARAAYGARRPHRMLIGIERGQADAMASNNRPRDAVPLLRQGLADQRLLDVEETARVREMMTFLGKSLLLSGALEEAAALFAESAALLERLAGGGTHEDAGAQTWRGRVLVMQGDGAGALAFFDRADEIARPLGEEGLMQRAHRASLRALAMVQVGRDDEVLQLTDPASEVVATAHGQILVRFLHARAAALRALGRTGEAVGVARQALEVAQGGDSPGLEHGLALAEAARCHEDAGERAEAARCRREALAVWAAGQVDGMAARQPDAAAFSEVVAAG